MPRIGWKNWVLINFIILATVLPYLVAVVPDAADYPNHLARHHVLASIGHGSALDRYFIVMWRWIGNLGVDLPVLALTPVMGVEPATRLVASAIAPLMAIGILLLSRAAHGRVTASAALALPFVFALPFLYGFLNYCLSVALALIVVAFWLARKRASLWSVAGFTLAGVLVWTAHIMGWMILLALVAGAELAATRSVRELPHRILSASPFLLPIVPLLLWRGDASHQLFWYAPDLPMQKVMNFVTILKGLSKPLDLAMTAAIGLATGMAILWAGGRKVEPRLAAGGVLLMFAALLGPTTALGSWGADLRLTPYAVMICIMAVGPATEARRERWLLALGLGLFFLRAGYTTVQWLQSSRGYEARLAILNDVPRNSRLGFIVLRDHCGSDWAMKADRKLGSYSIVRRDTFTNTLFQIPGSDLMIIRQPEDRERWLDGSQELAPLCPKREPDLGALKTRMAQMRAAHFDGIWVAGLPTHSVPALPGYRLSRALEYDTLLVREP